MIMKLMSLKEKQLQLLVTSYFIKLRIFEAEHVTRCHALKLNKGSTELLLKCQLP